MDCDRELECWRANGGGGESRVKTCLFSFRSTWSPTHHQQQTHVLIIIPIIINIIIIITSTSLQPDKEKAT